MSGRAVGLALAAGRGVFAWWPASSASPGSAQTEDFRFDADALAAGDDATLLAPLRAAQLASLRTTPDARARCELHVALASPWTAPREVALPPMRESEARRVLARDAARYFPILRAEPAVAVRALRRGMWLACDADGVVLDAIARSAHAAGFAAVRVIPAVAAWTHAAGDAHAATFVLDGEMAVLGAHHGRLTSLRRCRAADSPMSAAASADALALAARHAHRGDEREFVSAAQRAARDASATRMVRRLLLTGLAAIVAAVVLQASGGAYQVAQLERQRAALQPTIAPLQALRDSLLDLQEAQAALVRGRTAAPWSARLLALAATLPDGAYFTALRAAGDSVVVEGIALDAEATVARFKAGRGVRRVHPMAATASADGDHQPFSAIVFFGAGGTQ